MCRSPSAAKRIVDLAAISSWQGKGRAMPWHPFCFCAWPLHRGGRTAMASHTDASLLVPEARAFYRDALRTLRAARLPYLVGGAYALEQYTGIARHTKDLD